jgi:hypothetical protein
MSAAIYDINYSLYSSAMRLAKRFIEPSKIDKIERNLNELAARATGVVSLIGIGCFSLLSSIRATADLPCFPEDKSKIPPSFLIASLLSPVALYLTWKVYQSKITESILPYRRRFIAEEISTLVKASETNDKSALLIRPATDQRETFTFHTEPSVIQQSTKNHKIRHISVSSAKQMREEMNSDTSTYDKVILRSHANSDFLKVGERVHLTKRSKNTLSWLKNHTKEGAIISIEGCGAAKGEENIAREISRACPHATIYASEDTTDSIRSTTYNEQGVPSFNLFGVMDTTRVYKDGTMVWSAMKDLMDQLFESP